MLHAEHSDGEGDNAVQRTPQALAATLSVCFSFFAQKCDSHMKGPSNGLQMSLLAPEAAVAIDVSWSCTSVQLQAVHGRALAAGGSNLSLLSLANNASAASWLLPKKGLVLRI